MRVANKMPLVTKSFDVPLSAQAARFQLMMSWKTMKPS